MQILNDRKIAIVCGEVKDCNASKEEVEVDHIRVCESTKGNLHERMYVARTEREFFSYGIIMACVIRTFFTALPFFSHH